MSHRLREVSSSLDVHPGDVHSTVVKALKDALSDLYTAACQGIDVETRRNLGMPPHEVQLTIRIDTTWKGTP